MKKISPTKSDFFTGIGKKAWHDCDAEMVSAISDGVGAVVLGFSDIGG